MEQSFFYPCVDLGLPSYMDLTQKQYSHDMYFAIPYQTMPVTFVNYNVGQPETYLPQPPTADSPPGGHITMTPFEMTPETPPLVSDQAPLSPFVHTDFQALAGFASPQDDSSSVTTMLTPSMSPISIPLETPVQPPTPRKTKKPKTTRRRKSQAEKLPYASNMISLNLSTTRRPNKTAGNGNAATRPSVSFRCDYPGCEKTFTRPYNLKSHRRTHTAERPFSCSYCTKRFARQHDRNRHSKLHLGIKPFVCSYCNKAFARHDALNRHQRVDSAGEPAFALPPCATASARHVRCHTENMP